MRLSQRANPSPLWLAGALLLTGASGCTDANLIVVMPPPGPHARQQIIAEVCAPTPLLEEAPYKILFVIDTSFSNSWNDPDGRREAAVRNAITDHLAEPTVSFGIITFSDDPRRQTFGFTRDIEILDGATENIRAAQGGTNYSDTMWEVVDFIIQDANSLDQVELARTHYVVLWLSDGIPTVGVTDTTALTPGVTYLRDQLSGRAAEITMSTLYLGGIDPTTPAEMAEAISLLQEMASSGDGTFTDIPAGEDFNFEIDPQPIVNTFTFLIAVANNRHARLHNGEPAADSDADGIVDTVEIELGLDPTLADTDGDGYRDGVELLLPMRFDPVVHDPGCAAPEIDTDNDGLNDCEEFVVGTVPDNPDTDGDTLLDSIEVLAGTAALDGDPLRDTDMDGIGDWDEVLTHLPARTAGDTASAEAWAYRYRVEETTEQSVGTPCYSIVVENLWMAHTLETPDHPEGGNVIDLVVIFGSTGAQSHVRYYQSELRGIYLPPIQEPANGRFEVTGDLFIDLYGSTCSPGETVPCGTELGECSSGLRTCGADGRWGAACDGAVMPASELCNGLDDDCNGAVDDAPDCAPDPTGPDGIEASTALEPGAADPPVPTVVVGSCVASATVPSSPTVAWLLILVCAARQRLRRRRTEGTT